jgi:predicted NBD/HSP70 family sugar kinase
MRLGVDIGGTKTAAVVLGPSGDVQAAATAPSGRGPRDVVSQAAHVAHLAMAQVGGPAAVTSVGVCIPGLVDPATGTVRHAVNLDVEELDLRSELGSTLGTDLAVENDVKAAAVGVHHLRGLDPRETLAYLNLGTGLAAAVVHAGEVVRGADGVAGEIGHLPFGGGMLCACGQTGCLETVASGSALLRMWPQAPELDWDLAAAVDRGDRTALLAAMSLHQGVALAVQVLVLAAGAQLVVIGGGLARLGRPLLDGVRAEQLRRAADSPLLASLRLDERIELLAPGTPVAAIGAARLGRRAVVPAPERASWRS